MVSEQRGTNTERLGSNHSDAAYQLCDFGQAPLSLWACFLGSEKMVLLSMMLSSEVCGEG